MDLFRALQTFSRITETGSFSAVARETRSSHTAVARLIGQLEAHFGVRLFHRTTRSLSLTEDGKELLSHTPRVLDATMDMESALGSHRNMPAGLVRLGLSATTALVLVPRMTALFECYPGLAVELVVRDHFGDLVEERLDVVLQASQPSDTSSVTRVVATAEPVLVAAPIYLQRYGKPEHPTHLTDHRCIIYEVGPDSAVWQFRGPEGPIEIVISGTFRANNRVVVHHAALAGYGIAALPLLAVAEDLRTARLCRLLADYPSEPAPTFLIYPSRRHLAPRTRVVIDFLVKQLKLAQTQMEAEFLGGGKTAIEPV
jgi:DNA-binding transcriptional LysR family regulator